MPRKGRGGARTGDPATPYGNRTDLTLPNQTAPGQEYGAASEQSAGQAAVPMAAGQRGVGAPGPTAPAGSPVQQVPAPVPPPGTMPFLHPTNRPDEPVTAGAPTGPGAGPEALGTMRPSMSVADELQSLLQTPDASPALQRLAATARTMGV